MSEQFSILLGNHSRLEAGQTDGAWLPMDSGELEYIQNGNRRLIADAAIWDWYHRAKRSAKPPTTQGG